MSGISCSHFLRCASCVTNIPVLIARAVGDWPTCDAAARCRRRQARVPGCPGTRADAPCVRFGTICTPFWPAQCDNSIAYAGMRVRMGAREALCAWPTFPPFVSHVPRYHKLYSPSSSTALHSRSGAFHARPASLRPKPLMTTFQISGFRTSYPPVLSGIVNR